MKYLNLTTVQGEEVLKKLKQGKTYFADYGKIQFSCYVEQYKRLAKHFKFKETPIFCAPSDADYAIEASNCEGETIELKVPIEECHICDYYGWSDYLYYSYHWNDRYRNKKDAEDLWHYTPLEALKHLKRYLGEPKSGDTIQVVLNRIEPKWVKNI